MMIGLVFYGRRYCRANAIRDIKMAVIPSFAFGERIRLMLTVVGPVLAAILTGLVGNRLVQQWQQRNWYAQQRQTAQQQELNDLNAFLDDLTASANARLFSMKGLAATISKGEVPDQKVMAQYEMEVKKWNIDLPSFYNRTSLLLSSGATYLLENEVQKGFYVTGRYIERAVRIARNGNQPTAALVQEIQINLSKLNVASRNLFLMMSKKAVEKRRVLQNGRKILYKNGDLREYTTFDLIKALFVPDVERMYVVRPA